MDSRSWLRILALAGVAATLTGSPAGARAGEACDAGGGPSSVSLILVASPSKVHEFARATRGQILRRGSDTVVPHLLDAASGEIGACRAVGNGSELPGGRSA